MRKTGLRSTALLLLAFSVTIVAAAPAAAVDEITPSRSSAVVAGAMTDSLAPGVVTLTNFDVLPVSPAATPDCQDGIDNDDDGRIDFTPPVGGTADPDCVSAQDNSEFADLPPACSDGFDNDFDGLVDFTPPAGETADPGCTSATDNQEVEGEPDPTPACANGLDDDFDGLVDFVPPAGETKDPGCTSASDLDESSEGSPPGEDTNPAATSTLPLAGFPTSGSSYAVMSSGDTTFADDPNTSGGTTQDHGGGGGSHGSSFFDMVTLTTYLQVPQGVNCLAVDFRFFSEEFPEFVGSSVNDGFVAELDVSDFTADAAQNNAVVAPHNFAFDQAGKVISINTAGFSAADAAGTTYDGATPLLRATTPITAGAHTVFFSVFDQGDPVLDSTVFLDHLRLFNAPAGTCKAGTRTTWSRRTRRSRPGRRATTDDSTPTFSFTSTEAGSTFECRIDAAAFAPCTTPFTTAPLADGRAHVRGAGDRPGGQHRPDAGDAELHSDKRHDAAGHDDHGRPDGHHERQHADVHVHLDRGGVDVRVPGRRRGVRAVHDSRSPRPRWPTAPHTFEVRATDAAGNTDPTPATRSFTVDTTPPDTTITAGPTGTTSDSTPTFTFTSTEAGSTFQCRVDAAAFATARTPFTTAALTDGAHTFEVRATDAAGNTDATPAQPADVHGRHRRRRTRRSPAGRAARPTQHADVHVHLHRGGRRRSSAGSTRAPSRPARRRSPTVRAGQRHAHVRGARHRRGGQRRPDAGARRTFTIDTVAPHDHDHRRSDRDDQRQHADLHVHLVGGRLDVPVPGRRRRLRRLHDAVHDRRPAGRRAHLRGARHRRRGEHRRDARDADVHDRDCTAAARGPHLRG